MPEHASNGTGISEDVTARLPQRFEPVDTSSFTRADWAHFVADDRPHKPTSVVYFVGHLDHAIKIGVTKALDARFRELQCGSPVLLSILATRPGGIDREAAYHIQFAEHRLHGEWFSPHPTILAEVARLNAEGAGRG